MKARFVILMFVLVFVAALGVAQAQRGMGGPGMTAGQCGLSIGLGLGPAAVQELSLTNNQVAQLQKIRDQFLSDTQSARVELQTRLKELAQLWTAEKPNESAIRNKISRIDTLRTQIRNAMITRTFTVMRVLTADQKVKLRNLVKNRAGFGAGMGAGLGLGCDYSAAGCCYMGGPGGGRGFRGGRNQ
jgi:Spy/CpxP family protein refolding chaperone